MPDHTFADLARALNRSPVYLRGLRTRFALPVLEGAACADSYLAFLRKIGFLRTFGVSEDALRVLEGYLTTVAALCREVADELPHVRAALSFARQLVPQTKPRRSTANP